MSPLGDLISRTNAVKQSGSAHEPLLYLARIGLWGDAQGWQRRYLPQLALAQVVYGIVTQVINVVQTWGKLVVAAEFCVALLTLLMTLIKIGCLVANAGKIQEVVTALDAMRESHARTDDVNHIVRRTRSKSDKFARIMHKVCSILLFLFMVGNLMENYGKRAVPFRRWYPYDIKPSPVYELTLVIFSTLAYFDFYVILLFDLLVLCLLIEVIGEFQVLQHRLQNINFSVITTPRSQDNALLKNSVSDALKQHLDSVVSVPITPSKQRPTALPTHSDSPEQRLAACVVHHQALIKLVEKLETTFQPGLVIHLVLNLCVGLTLVFVTLKSDKLDVMVVSMLVLGLSCTGEFAVYCFFCTLVTTESSLVGEALYACAWWNASAGFKSSMRIVQLRTNQPIYIRAAILPMSMETFTKVMNTAYNVYGLMLTTN